MQKYFKHIKKTTLNFNELRKRFYTISVYGTEIKLQGDIKNANCTGWDCREEDGNFYYNKKFEHNGHEIEICLTN